MNPILVIFALFLSLLVLVQTLPINGMPGQQAGWIPSEEAVPSSAVHANDYVFRGGRHPREKRSLSQSKSGIFKFLLTHGMENGDQYPETRKEGNIVLPVLVRFG